jgi:hypothetical protein
MEKTSSSSQISLVRRKLKVSVFREDQCFSDDAEIDA